MCTSQVKPRSLSRAASSLESATAGFHAGALAKRLALDPGGVEQGLAHVVEQKLVIWRGAAASVGAAEGGRRWPGGCPRRRDGSRSSSRCRGLRRGGRGVVGCQAEVQVQ